MAFNLNLPQELDHQLTEKLVTINYVNKFSHKLTKTSIIIDLVEKYVQTCEFGYHTPGCRCKQKNGKDKQ